MSAEGDSNEEEDIYFNPDDIIAKDRSMSVLQNTTKRI